MHVNLYSDTYHIHTTYLHTLSNLSKGKSYIKGSTNRCPRANTGRLWTVNLALPRYLHVLRSAPLYNVSVFWAYNKILLFYVINVLWAGICKAYWFNIALFKHHHANTKVSTIIYEIEPWDNLIN